ncbi:ubiquitin thioesterase OTUB2 isoform X2 [Dendrobates tinctorius]|uniref:ubiquitin thioesterase OTUB2 isoform X2 n=1 Tax=Dendrobates tinctorius TaxID=92724 RepID=UPI003CCA1F36
MKAADLYGLISEKCDLAVFIAEHCGEPLCRQRLKGLQGHYCAARRTCADGSCFYRGLGFAFLEYLLHKPQDLLRFRERVTHSQKELMAAAFQDNVYRHHYETFLSLVDLAAGEVTATGEAAADEVTASSLLKAFNHPYISDSAVRYLRLVTSAFLRSRADFFLPFLEHVSSMDEFCAQSVEPMMAVCDHIQIMAVTQALDISLQVEYVDSRDVAITQHIFPEGSCPCVYMLYNEDHYTLLYKEGAITPVVGAAAQD